jgi:hypothetical protein
MVMSEPRVPAALLQEVARDLRPVRPLASPARRALTLAPVGLLLLVGVPAFWGWRENLPLLDASMMWGGMVWGPSGLQTLAGLLIAGAALREAVPGRALSRTAIIVTITLAIALVLGVTLLTEAVLPTVMPAGVWLRWAWECGGVAVLSALPALTAIAWLASRALPSRPALAGAMYGLGAGMMADSGMRLFCRISDPLHVLVAHGGAIAVLMLLGALISVIVERTKARLRVTA